MPKRNKLVIKKPSFTLLATMYGYGRLKPNYQLMADWKESEDDKLNKRYDALAIGYIMQSQGFDLTKTLIMVNKKLKDK